MAVVTAADGTSRDRGLLADVSALLDEVRRVVGPTAEDTVARLKGGLHQPLTLAVTGRTNAGKSTLINALIRARVVPTRATECTRVVTWFRFGPHQPQVVCSNGDEVGLWLTDQGRLPDELPVPADQVERVDVWLDSEPLRALTVIDTPGLSGDEGLADQTEQLLAQGHVDVLLFVFGATIRDDERRIVADYRTRGRWLYDFPANAHGVVSRADQFSGPDGPWAEAQAVAAHHAAALATELAGVLPVMGKLAETTETGAFNEGHAGWLRTVAALPADERDRALRYPRAFARHDVLTPAARMALLDRLDVYGIRELTSPVHAHSSAVDMADTLRASSGIAALLERIDVLFVRPAPVHKAVRVLAGLEEFVRGAAQRGEMRENLLDQIQIIRDSPAMHTVAELRALAALYSGRCNLGDTEATSRALRLFEESHSRERLGCDADDPGELANAAADAARCWKSSANGATDPLTRLVAETAAMSAYLLHASLRSRA